MKDIFNFDLNKWVSIITALTSIVAIIIAIYTLKKDRKRTGILIMLDLNSRFDSQEFKLKRKKVAMLMNKIHKDFSNKTDSIDSASKKFKIITNHQERGDVIDFFNTMGYLGKRKIIDVEFAANDYVFWLYHYWEFFANSIIEERKNDSGLWMYAEWLYKEFKRTKNHKKRNLKTNFETFIEYEINI